MNVRTNERKQANESVAQKFFAIAFISYGAPFHIVFFFQKPQLLMSFGSKIRFAFISFSLFARHRLLCCVLLALVSVQYVYILSFFPAEGRHQHIAKCAMKHMCEPWTFLSRPYRHATYLSCSNRCVCVCVLRSREKKKKVNLVRMLIERILQIIISNLFSSEWIFLLFLFFSFVLSTSNWHTIHFTCNTKERERENENMYACTSLPFYCFVI